MKRLAHLHIMAPTLAFMVFAGTSAFAADLSNALNGDNHLLSTSDFSALSGVSADPMNEAELEQVQGKFQPCVYKDCFIPIIIWDNPLCWVDGCGGPGPLFRGIDPVSLRGAVVVSENVLVLRGVNPEPQPWKEVISEPIPLPWKGLSKQVMF